MKKLTFLAFLITSFANNMRAQTGEKELYSDFEKVDKELSAAYNELQGKLIKSDKEALTKSQNDWLKFRASNCVFKSKENTEGGVIANKMKLDCEIEMTKARIKEIMSIITDEN